MARETKVGLLAGLAFIICFAVILANRGRDVSVAMDRPVVSDPGISRLRSEPPPARPDPSTHVATPSGMTDRGTFLTQATSPITSERPPLQRLDSIPTSGADAGFAVREQGDGRTTSALPITPSNTAASPSPASHTTSSPSNDQIPMNLPHSTESRGSLETRPITESNGHAGSPLPGSDRTSTQQTHRVAPGDTLSSIAAAYYGSKSGTIITAIHDANRSVLPNPDVLRTGLDLHLPVVSGTAGPVVGKNAASPPSAKPSAPPVTELRAGNQERPKRESTPDRDDKATIPQWYQVKKGDRYASIARDQLGDAGRWQEIYEMNKEKFPDPKFIREGVRIKLPIPAARDARDARR